MEALRQPTIRVVAVIAEGVPEGDTKKLIAYARANNKILIGPATVGGVQVCALGPGSCTLNTHGGGPRLLHTRGAHDCRMLNSSRPGQLLFKALLSHHM